VADSSVSSDAVPTPSGEHLVDKVRPYAGRLAWGGFLLLVTQCCEKAIPWLFRVGLDALTSRELTTVRNGALGVIALSGLAWFVRTNSRIQVFNVGRDVEFDLRNQVLARIHLLGPSFFRRMSTGDIMSRATNDLGQVRLLVGFGALNVVNSVFAFISSITLMFAVSPSLTGLALIPYPFLTLSAMGFGRAMFKRSGEAQVAIADLAGRVQEDVAGTRIARSLGLEERQRDRFEVVNARAIDKNMRLVSLRALMWPVMMGLSSIGTLIVVWRGGTMVLEGDLSVGQFAAFNAYLAQLVWPTLAFGYLLGIVQRGRASYERVRKILVAAPDVAEAPDAVPAGQNGALSVRGLSYEVSGRKVLSDVSFEVPAGTSLAVVGSTGSGKSTLASLLPRLLSTPEGAVFLDGDDVTKVKLAELRRTIGFAQQEPFLFSTTVEANLALALDEMDPSAARARMEHAASEASVREEIETLPDGWSTIVGERGVQLSGGQKQRVALSRALLGAPRVLVLDDPLSAVDARTEASILSALERAAEGRTLVLVTHRIAAAARCDRVLVLDGGRVVEEGTHEQLARGKGLYARLASRQRLEKEIAEL
jgi:ATP-binding cassette subfamily B multidrug efflux pump